MPITDAYARLPLSAIFVPRDDRQRRDINTKNLLESIRARGVLQPIIVHREPEPDGRHKLTVGERRYTASLELGLPDIPVRFVEDLSPIEAQIFELEENLKRQDLEWKDEVKAIARIHVLYRTLSPAWTQNETAEALGLSPASISQRLRVFEDLALEPIQKASSYREAYNILARRDQRTEAEVIEDILGSGPELRAAAQAEAAAQTAPVADNNGPSQFVHGFAKPTIIVSNPTNFILHESFLQWAPRYTGQPFNLIHCDFPYGIKVFDGPQSGRSRHLPYLDSSDVHTDLLECLLVNIDRIASHSCHILYWFSIQHYQHILQAVSDLAPSLTIHRHPLIWLKSDNAGIASDPRHGPRHIYETCLFMTRGQRQIVRVVGDAYAAPTDHQWHIHTKPEPVLRHFMTMLVDNHTSILDPTCGSGSSLRAAESLGATRVLGMDIDEQIVGMARLALRNSRMLRGQKDLVI